ncbi:iron-containing alcohol dehydrogenase [Brevibacillus choshinensis]|uniref:Iron-containing alcohol dehydrogenase n=1 Tax=Brevibacillus choshinensis TaxID=54911 RepID=A0ABX7FHI6_BRECH|nr:iron-containing alcohol dehydrogenase [Brevibacillus choshinensis]QRG65199.1 iron-containing alcohol dehydrogenase [Brevibacillus choshinensis]
MRDHQEFFLGTRLIFGPGCVEKMGDEIRKQGSKDILIVTDAGIVKSGVFDAVRQVLDASRIGYEVYDQVEPNPDVWHVDRSYLLMHNRTFDLIIAIGGGSVIDTAKALALLLTNKGFIRDYEGRGIFKNDAIPLFAVPTTVGTGSEVTRACVISDHERHRKMIVGGPSLAPKVTFLDANLVTKLPSHLVAATGIDALTHAIEGFVSKNANPITDALNLYAIHLISSSIRPAVADSSNLEAINGMLMASTITGIGAGNASLGIVHAISHVIGGHYEVSHGMVNGILLPHAIKWNWIANPMKFATIHDGLAMNPIQRSTEEKAKGTAETVRSLLQDINLPQSLREVGVDHSKLDEMAEQASKDGYLLFNPRRLSKDNIKTILQSAM